jgi:exodeoxyribonuclease VII small subunit
MVKTGDTQPDPSAGPPGKSSPAELPFEAALEKLEQVVDRLEQGDLELEESLAAFEEGVGLSRRCATQLEDAEQRVEVLMREGGKWLARPFADADDDDSADDEDLD